MDELKSKLVATAIDLLQNHKISHVEIKDLIFQGIKELSDKLPKHKVLYNAAHGGFDFSTQFKAFLKHDVVSLEGKDEDYTDDDTDDDVLLRMAYVKKVKKFGTVCKQHYPFIIKLIGLYNQYRMGDIARYTYRIQNCQIDLEKLASAHEVVVETDAVRFGSEVDIELVGLYNFKLDTVLKYTKEAVLSWFKDKKEKLEAQIVASNDNISRLVGSDKCEWVVKNFNVTFEEEAQEGDLPWYAQKKWNERIVPGEGMQRFTFLDAIDHYGEDHFAIWNCQTHYSKQAMRFLLKHHEAFQLALVPSDDNDMVYDMEMGLLCASSAYCELRVGEAPQLLSWYIGEYDGLESIVVRP